MTIHRPSFTGARSWVAAALFGAVFEGGAGCALAPGDDGHEGEGEGDACGAGSNHDDDGVCTSSLRAWASGPALVEARDHHFTLAMSLPSGDYVYVFGGLQNQARPVMSVERARLGSDGTLGAFAIVDTLPEWFSGGPLAVVGRRVFVFAPMSAQGPTIHATVAVNVGIVHDDGTFDWSRGEDLEVSRFHAGAAVVRGRVYVVGGADADFNNSDSVQSAAISEDGIGSWRRERALPYAWSHGSLASDGMTLFLSGGVTGDVRTADAYDTVLVGAVDDDGAIASWTEAPSYLPTRRLVHASFVRDDHLYVIGGLSEGTSFGPGVRARIRGATLEPFEEFPALPDARAHVHQAALLGAYVVFTAGVTFEDAFGEEGHHVSHAETFIGTFE